VQVILCDDDGRRARLAAATAERMGYTRVAVLDGGINAWSVDGLPTEWGMNVISKDFGERVEVQSHVPTIGVRELNQRMHRGDPLVILDTRTPEEYQRFCIPGGRSVPGGELALRITDIVREQPDATVIVNCAGRTRSIIGARVLQRMGLPNVLSLRNGTSGWVLAGLELEQGAARVDLPDLSPEGRAAAEAFALRVAEEDGVRFLSVEELDALLTTESDAPVYRIDVRTEAEFTKGHIPGFWWFPGGQAVQRADDLAAVCNGTIIFGCDGITRAAVTASWYRQLGFPNVYAVRGGVTAWQDAGRTVATGPDEAIPFGLTDAAARVHSLDINALESARASARPPLLLFVEPSNEFARSHIPGSHWLPRGWLEPRIAAFVPDLNAPLVITDTDGRNALLAAATLQDLGYTNVAALDGGMAAWRAAGRTVEQGLTGVMQPPDDLVPAGPDRSYADMIHYLHWEERLGDKYGDTATTEHAPSGGATTSHG
jgi:rhodanese-related sulfurtransferase